MSRWGRGGAGDFSEELPALLVVLVALSVFVAGVAQAYSSFTVREKSIQRRERVAGFLAALRSDGSLTRDQRPGLFDHAALADANASRNINGTYPPARLGFRYSLAFGFLASGGAWENFTIGTGERPAGAEAVSLSSPCDIVDADGAVRPGMLRATAWGFER